MDKQSNTDMSAEPSSSMSEIAQLLGRLKKATSNTDVREVQERLYQLEKMPNFLSSIIQIICTDKHEGDIRVAAATYIRRVISRSREADLNSKMEICKLIIILLRSNSPVKLKKIALTGSSLLLNASQDPDRLIHQQMCNKLEQELDKDNQHSEIVNPLVLQYIILLGQLLAQTRPGELPLDFIIKTFDRYVLAMVRVLSYCESVVLDTQTSEQECIHCISLLKELTLLLRIYFQRQDFLASGFFKEILMSKDLVMLLERVYVMQSGRSELKQTLIEVSTFQVCSLMNDAKSNSVAIQYTLLKNLQEFDKRDNTCSNAYIYERSPFHLDLFLASIINSKWLNNQHHRQYKSVTKAVEQMLRFAATAVQVSSCYEYFSSHRDRWTVDFLFKMFEMSEAELEEFREEPENYLAYIDQMVCDKPDPSKLDSEEEQQELVVHMAASLLLNKMCRFIDGVLSFICQTCMHILIHSKTNDSQRLVSLKILGVIRTSMLDRVEFMRQIAAYFQLRVFTKPKHIIESMSQFILEIESCIHILILSKYLKCLSSLSSNMQTLALRTVMDILTNTQPATVDNPALMHATMYLVSEAFKHSSDNSIEVLDYLLTDLTPQNVALQRLDAILQIVCDSRTIHSHANIVKACANTMIKITDYYLQIANGIILAQKAWDIIVQLCCNKLLHPQNVALLQHELRPIIKYIKQPVRVDFGDEFIQILLNFVSKAQMLDEFLTGSVSLLIRIFDENDRELDEMLHLINLYLQFGGNEFLAKNPSSVVIFTEMALRGLDSNVPLQGRLQAAILLHALSSQSDTLWQLGLMNTILNKLHSIFAEESIKMSPSLAENLLAALILIAAASVRHLPQKQLIQILNFCLPKEQHIKDPYTIKAFSLAILTIIKASTKSPILVTKLEELTKTSIKKIYQLYTRLRKLSDEPNQSANRTERYSKMMSRLHNIITEMDEFTEFKRTFDHLRLETTSLFEGIMGSLSLTEKQQMKMLYGVHTLSIGARQIVKIKRP